MFPVSRRSWVLVLAVASIGCAAGTQPSPFSERPEAGVRTNLGPDSATVHCLDEPDIDAERVAAIASAAERFIGFAVQRDAESFKASLSQATRASVLDERFQKVFDKLAGRLADADVERTDLRLITLDGPFAGPAMCGAAVANVPSFLIVGLAGGAGEYALVRFGVDRGALVHEARLLLSAEPDGWAIAAFDVSAMRWQGRTANDYLELAEGFQERSEMLESWLAVELASRLSGGGSMAMTAVFPAANELAEHVRSSPAFGDDAAALGAALGDTHVISVGSIGTPQEIGLWIRYVSRGGIDPDRLGREADRVVGHLLAEHPSVRELFESVVFEAFAEPPTDPQRDYETHRTTRRFDDRRYSI